MDDTTVRFEVSTVVVSLVRNLYDPLLVHQKALPQLNICRGETHPEDKHGTCPTAASVFRPDVVVPVTVNAVMDESTTVGTYPATTASAVVNATVNV